MSIKKKILSVVMLCLLFLLGAAEGLAGEALNPSSRHILRLHILAAGNTPEQQAAKYRLRDLILAELAQVPELEDTSIRVTASGSEGSCRLAGAAKAEQYLAAALPRILGKIRHTLEQEGLREEISYSFGYYPFPTRCYGGIVYPRGTYRALRIVIGTGAGRNWWCLLFPPLCLQSAAQAQEELPETAQKSPSSSSPGYVEAIQQETQIEIRFFLIEWLRQLFSANGGSSH